MIFQLVLVLLTFVGFIYYKLVKNRNYWSDRGVPSTKFKFLLGDDGDLFFKEALHEWSLRVYKEHPNKPYIGMWALFGKPYLMIRNDFELIRNIWIKDFDHFAIANTNVQSHPTTWKSDRNEKLMMSNVQSSYGEEWKNIRATFSPIFTSGKLKKMTPLLQAVSRKMHSHVLNLAKTGEAFETKDLGGKFSLDGLASCAFGVETGSFDNADSEFLQHSKNVFKFDGKVFLRMVISQAMLPNVAKKIFYNLGLGSFFAYPFANEHSKFLMHVVEASFKQRQQSKTKRNDLLDMMIEAVEGNLADLEDDDMHAGDQFEKDAKIQGTIKKKNLSYDDVIATAILLLAAGYDTTGTSLSWIFYDLAMNQSAQDNLYEEIIEAGKDANKLPYDTLQNLPYLDAVIHESLRRHVPVATLERVCTKDYKVPNSNILIKKGDFVRLNNVGIMMDPEIYPNPSEFNPERFLKEYAADRNPYSFLTFSLGPRNCIGMRFSMYEMKCCISNLISKFRFIPCEKTVKYEDLEFSRSDAFGGTSHGLWIKCEER